MNTIYPIASVAELIGEPARAAVLVALLDGRSLTAGELALIAYVSAQSASAHLSKMVAGGLLKARSSGRHRYYSLAGPDVAHAMEALGAIATLPRPSTAPQSQNELEIRKARSCYDHLAGRIAVEMVKALETSKVIRISGDRDYELGRNGRSWFSNLGIDTDALQRSRRSFARAWTGPSAARILPALWAPNCARER